MVLSPQTKLSRERGFTLIELLTVIIIIGILAAVAIPVFSSQRGRTQDSQTISDVRNIVTAAETYLSDRTKNVANLSQGNVEYASSKNVLWDIKGNTTTGGYCVAAYNSLGKVYKDAASALTYDSTGGGLKASGSSCANGLTPSTFSFSSTAVGSSTATAPVASSMWGGQFADAPNTAQSATSSSVWAASGVRGFWQMAYDGTNFYAANQNLGLYKITNSGTVSVLNNEQPYTGVTVVGGRIYATNNNSIYLVSNTGSLTPLITAGSYIRNLTTDGTYLYVAYDNKVLKSTLGSNGEITSSIVLYDLTNTAYSNDVVLALAVDKSNNIYFSSNSGRVFKNGSVWATVPDHVYNMIGGTSKLYYVTPGREINGSTQHVIRSISLSSPSTITTEASVPSSNGGHFGGIATDGTYLYGASSISPASGSVPAGVYRF